MQAKTNQHGKMPGSKLIRSARSGFHERTARWFAFAAIIWLIGLSSETALCASDAQFPSLVSDTNLAAEGYFVLTWRLDDGDAMGKLQQSTSPGFGSDTETSDIVSSGSVTLTGFPNGKYYFRAGTPGHWSKVLEITVRHHALSRAFAFFATGLFLFIVLCVVIITGNRQAGEQKD